MDTQAYKKAMDALKVGDYKAAEHAFKIAFDSVYQHIGLSNDGQYNNVESCYGLAQVLNDNEQGLLLCRNAASDELLNGDVFLNLACAELESNNRKRAIDAIQCGLKIDPGHTQLHHACTIMDCRKRDTLVFLPREHIFNRLLGRLRRRPGKTITVHYLLFEK